MKQYSEPELLHLYALFINQHKINIAEEYDEWLNVAFACASCGEDARDDFDYIARQSSKFQQKTQNQKWRNALKTGKAVGIGYIVNRVKDFGVETRDVVRWYNREYKKGFALDEMSIEAPAKRQTKKNSTGISKNAEIPRNVPEIPSLADSESEAPTAEQNRQKPVENRSELYELTKSVKSAIMEIKELTPLIDLSGTDEQLTAAAWGLLAGLSAVSKKTYIRYDGKKQHVHFYYLLAAPAASGKGILSDVRSVFSDIQARERQRARENWENYKSLLKAIPKDQHETIPKPQQPTFWLPADTSTSALISAVRDNDGGGCIWESEIDTINRAIKSDYGNYTDALRNNYHSETITYLRKTGREFINLDDSHFAACIAGTMGQVTNFFKSTENGLFSRWAFGTLAGSTDWADKFSVADKSQPIAALALVVNSVRMANEWEGEITFTKEQQKEHINFYAQKQSEMVDTLGDAAVSFVRRSALTHLRLAAVLAGVVGKHSGACPSPAWRLASALAAHSIVCGARVIADLPESEAPAKRKAQRAAALLAQLPDKFTSSDIPEGISRATYFRYISEWVAAGAIVRSGKEWIKQ